jgi:hypothetical protein
MRALAVSFAVLIAAACGGRGDQPDPSASGVLASDCIGGPSPTIEVGRVGDLKLDLTLRELRRLCPQIRDTIARGDESLDTAVVISRPGLQVVGRVANIANDEGDKPYRVDSSSRIHYWTVTGTGAVLRGGVPLSARFDSLERAYGKAETLPLNGDVYAWFCDRMPEFVFHFAGRGFDGADSQPDSLPRRHITSVDFPGVRDSNSVSPFCRHQKKVIGKQ